MRMNRAYLPKRTLALACMALLCVAQAVYAADKKHKNTQKEKTLSEHDLALHALQRLTFGPRPGDLEQVLAMGVDPWITQQLDPAKIPDPAVDARMGPYRTLRMQPRELVQAFPNNQMIREAADGK